MNNRHITRMQYLIVLLAASAAALTLWSRQYLPAWAKPEYRPQTVTLQLPAMRFVADLPETDLASMPCSRQIVEWNFEPRTVMWCEYPGATTLLVTDSLGEKLPMPADRLVIFGGDPYHAASLLRERTAATYDAIFIWIGHGPLLQGEKYTRVYLSGMDELLQAAEARSEHVFACVPLYYDLQDPIAGKWRDRLMASGDTNVRAVADVRAALEARHDITVIPLDDLKRYGQLPNDLWWPDGFHLYMEGRIRVAQELWKHMPHV